MARRAGLGALVDVAESEELLADGLLALAAENRLAVVVGADARSRAGGARHARSGAAWPQWCSTTPTSSASTRCSAPSRTCPSRPCSRSRSTTRCRSARCTGAVALDLAASGVCPVLVAERAGRRHRPRRGAARGRGRPLARRRAPTTGPSSRCAWPDRTRRSCASGSWWPPRSPARSAVRGERGRGAASRRARSTRRRSSARDRGSRRRARHGGGAARRGRHAHVARRRGRCCPGRRAPALTRALVYAALRAGTEHVIRGARLRDRRRAGRRRSPRRTDRPRRTRLAELLAG